MSRSRRAFGLVALLAILPAGCIHNFWHTVPVRVVLPDTGTVVVKTPLKVHLVDGRTVVFKTGASIDRRAISGTGESYGMLASLSDPRATSRVPLDSVVGVETFEGRLLAAQTIVVSTAATVVTGAATIVLLKVLFGSCPTVYADSAGHLFFKQKDSHMRSRRCSSSATSTRCACVRTPTD